MAHKKESDLWEIRGYKQGDQDGVWKVQLGRKSSGQGLGGAFNPVTAPQLFDMTKLEERITSMKKNDVDPDISSKALEVLEQKQSKVAMAPAETKMKAHKERERAMLMGAKQ